LRAHRARDDADDTAHGVGAVQRRHRPADDFDALDRLHGRQPALLDARAIGIGPGFARVLALAVDQDHGVFRRHAANADVAVAAAAGDDDTRHVANGIGDILEGLLLQLL